MANLPKVGGVEVSNRSRARTSFGKGFPKKQTKQPVLSIGVKPADEQAQKKTHVRVST